MTRECPFNQQSIFDTCHILHQIPDIFLLVDEAGKIMVANNAIEKILGWKADEVLGASVEILLAPEQRNHHAKLRHQFFQKPTHRDMNKLLNLMAQHKKGYLVPVDIKLSFIEMDNATYSVAIVRDMTIQRQMQKELEKKNTELETLLQEKNHLLGIAAHDLRNPIGIIQNFSQILLTGSIGPLNDDQREFVQRINQSSQFMMGLLEDLLDFSAIESGTMNLRKEAFSLAALLKEVLTGNRIVANEKSIELIVKQDVPDDFKITADKAKLHQVLNNLISNAIKYSPSNSTVEISTSVSDDTLEFSVQDHGVGIPEEDLEHLFQPFFRANNKPTAGEKSTGLGLFITRRIIEAHGGTLHVDSRNGEGSRFSFHMPL